MDWPTAAWPESAAELVAVQYELADAAAAALAADPWQPPSALRVGGCYVAFARGEAAPGRPGDEGWAAAVVWQPKAGQPRRRADDFLRMSDPVGPRRASDVDAQAVVAERARAAYVPGLLALREGPILAAAVHALDRRPDVLLVDATGLDHPRGAGLALQLGAVCGVPTIGVTRRPLLASGDPPGLVRGESAPVLLAGRVVGCWVCTRTGARPVLAHAAWRTSPDIATELVLAASTEAARTPVPVQEARRVAREARALAGAATSDL